MSTAPNLSDIQKPSKVPSAAVFRSGPDGGYFILLERKDLQLSDGQILPAYWLEAYDSFSGFAEFKGIGIFVSDKEISSDGTVYYYDPPSLEEILSTAYFDGGELEFDIEGKRNVGRIIPIELKLEDR